jgi:hypothetical protein
MAAGRPCTASELAAAQEESSEREGEENEEEEEGQQKRSRPQYRVRYAACAVLLCYVYSA